MSAHDRLVGDYKQRSVNPHRLAMTRSKASSPILDIGCGHGEYIEALSPDHSVVGMDILEYEGRSRVVRGDAKRIPFDEDAFSTALMFEVLEHINNPTECLKEVRRVTRDQLLLSVPNAVDPSIFKSAGVAMHPFVDPTHVNFYDEEALRTDLEAAGFAVQEVRYINEVQPAILTLHMLGLPKSLSRKIGRRIHRLWWGDDYHMTLLVHATTA